MRLKVIRMDLPLKHVTTTPDGTVSVVRAVLVELEQDGLRGYGEAYEDAALGTTVETMAEKLDRSREILAHYALADPLAFHRHVAEFFGAELSALCALEMAACDLWGKMCNRPLWRALKLDPANAPISSFTVGQDSLDRALEKFDEHPDWLLYRLELGNKDDLLLLEELRRRTDAKFRVDANGRWTLEQTLDYMAPLQELGVELIEQPLPPGDWERMAILKENSPIPIYADQCFRSEADFERCAACFHGVNLRPIKFGGLIPTWRAINRAKELGLKTMIGNPVESAIASSAVAQLAPALDAVYLDGPLLIDKRIGNGVELDRGRIVYPKENGIGIRFSWR